MRYAPLFLALALFMIALPAGAAEGAQQKPAIFGFKKCKPTFQCPSAATREYTGNITKNVIRIATACTQTYFGISMPGGPFESAFGLDGSQCLTTKKIEKPANGGGAMTPKCCVEPTDSTRKTCGVTCTLYSIR